MDRRNTYNSISRLKSSWISSSDVRLIFCRSSIAFGSGAGSNVKSKRSSHGRSFLMLASACFSPACYKTKTKKVSLWHEWHAPISQRKSVCASCCTSALQGALRKLVGRHWSWMCTTESWTQTCSQANQQTRADLKHNIKTPCLNASTSRFCLQTNDACTNEHIFSGTADSKRESLLASLSGHKPCLRSVCCSYLVVDESFLLRCLNVQSRLQQTFLEGNLHLQKNTKESSVYISLLLSAQTVDIVLKRECLTVNGKQVVYCVCVCVFMRACVCVCD